MSVSPVDIGSKDDFPEGKGKKVNVKGRDVSVFRYNSTLYAMDHHCYHMGGPLAKGDIEDIVLNKETHPCVVCPWHQYKISLKTGEGIYVSSDPFAKDKKLPCVKSRGKKQRTHIVYQDARSERVMMILNEVKSEEYESDRYSEEDK